MPAALSFALTLHAVAWARPVRVWSYEANADTLDAWQIVHVGDVEGDHRGDALFRSAWVDPAPPDDLYDQLTSDTNNQLVFRRTALDAAVTQPASSTRLIALGDLNDDAFDDELLLLDATTGALGVRFGSPTGIAAVPRALDLSGPSVPPADGEPVRVYASAIYDHTVDGYDDFVVIYHASVADQLTSHSEVYLVRGGQSGYPTRTELIAVEDDPDWQFAEAALTGDLSGDGQPDLALLALHRTPGLTRSELTLWRGDGIGFEDTPWVRADNYPEGDETEVPHIQRAGDVNADGYDDIVWRIEGPSDLDSFIGVTLGGPSATGELTVTLEAGTNGGCPLHGTPNAVLAGRDLSDDGIADLLVLCAVPDQKPELRVYRGGPSGLTRWHAATWFGRFIDQAIVDLNNDSSPEIIVVREATPSRPARFSVLSTDPTLRGDGDDPCAHGDSGLVPLDCLPDPYDRDGDGHPTPAGGGDDCDDSNAEVYPDADDPTGDGLDSNCDGVDGVADTDTDSTPPPPTPDDPNTCGGCASAPSLPWFLLLLPVVRRRGSVALPPPTLPETP